MGKSRAADKALVKAVKDRTFGEARVAAFRAALDAGADANTRFGLAGDSRVAPLHVVSMDGSAGEAAALTELLLARGADINAQSGIGYTPLMFAATNLKMVTLLLDHGADPNIATPAAQEGRTAVLLAAWGKWGTAKDREDQLAVIELLVSKGADLHAVDSSGMNALDKARMATLPADVKQNDPVAKYLRERGLQVTRS
jgi:ankyrin repeat protein